MTVEVIGFGRGEVLSTRVFDGVEYAAVRIDHHIVFAKVAELVRVA